jgi:hypothetical protein
LRRAVTGLIKTERQVRNTDNILTLRSAVTEKETVTPTLLGGEIDEMRQRHEDEDLSYAQLADEYDISTSAVGFIIRKESWVRKDVYQINE